VVIRRSVREKRLLLSKNARRICLDQLQSQFGVEDAGVTVAGDWRFEAFRKIMSASCSLGVFETASA